MRERVAIAVRRRPTDHDGNYGGQRRGGLQRPTVFGRTSGTDRRHNESVAPAASLVAVVAERRQRGVRGSSYGQTDAGPTDGRAVDVLDGWQVLRARDGVRVPDSGRTVF